MTGETVDVHEVFLAFVCFPGGFGSLNELFESLTLIQTKKIQTFPIILVDSVFWKEFIDWIREQLLVGAKIDEEDLFLFEVFDELDDTLRHILKILII